MSSSSRRPRKHYSPLHLPSASLFLLLSAAALLAGCRTARDSSESGLEGRWEGQAVWWDGRLRLEWVSHEGGIIGRLSLPERGLYDVPLEDPSVGRRRIRFRVFLDGATAAFRGVRSGDLTRGMLTILGTGEVRELELLRLIEPVLPYRQVEVGFGGGPDRTAAAAQKTEAAGMGILAGTLSLPEGDGPFPAIVLVSPEGPHNRDAEIRGFPLFAALADLFTRRGVAVLRYDDRGVGRSGGLRSDGSSGVSGSPGLHADAEDAAKALEFLRNRKDIGKIGCLGYDGSTAIHAAATAGGVALLVLLSPPPWSSSLANELRGLDCPILTLCHGGADEERLTAFLGLMEDSGDYTAKRIASADELFHGSADSSGGELGGELDPAFRGFLLCWLDTRL